MGTATPGHFKKARYSEVTLPSGNTVRLKRVSIEEWIATGQVPNGLKPILAKALKGIQPTTKDILGGAESVEDVDEKRLAELIQMFDYAAIHCMMEPKCLPKPATEAERDENKLYVDEVGPEDKQFIFYWSTGGANDVERFRKGSAGALADLEAGQDVAPEAVGAGGDQ